MIKRSLNIRMIEFLHHSSASPRIMMMTTILLFHRSSKRGERFSMMACFLCFTTFFLWICGFNRVSHSCSINTISLRKSNEWQKHKKHNSKRIKSMKEKSVRWSGFYFISIFGEFCLLMYFMVYTIRRNH